MRPVLCSDIRIVVLKSHYLYKRVQNERYQTIICESISCHVVARIGRILWSYFPYLQFCFFLTNFNILHCSHFILKFLAGRKIGLNFWQVLPQTLVYIIYCRSLRKLDYRISTFASFTICLLCCCMFMYNLSDCFTKFSMQHVLIQIYEQI